MTNKFNKKKSKIEYIKLLKYNSLIIANSFLLLIWIDYGYAQVRPKKGIFEQLFQFERQVIVQGDTSNTIYSAWNPLIVADKIYMADYLGNQIFIYDQLGKTILKIGKKGKGPEEFIMPYGFFLDKKGNLYVNDRGNARVQIFDPSLKLMKLIMAPGQNEKIFLTNDENKPNIITIGVSNKHLIHQYDLNGKLINSFAPIEKEFVIYSWAATIDEDGNLYLINVLETNLYIFNRDYRIQGFIKLFSPSMRFLQKDLSKEPASKAELFAYVKALNEEEHTRIQDIFIHKGLLFVLLRYITKTGDKFILDIYNLKGELILYGIEFLDQICFVSDKIYAFKYDAETEYGRVIFKSYQFKSNFRIYK